MRTRIKIGVVGLGRIGWDFHCRELSRHPDFQLVAVADPDAPRREQAGKELGCEAHARFEELIARADMEAVVIATPTHLHRDMATQAFERGLHVILEKPMALDPVEAKQIVGASRRAGRVLTVFQPQRLLAAFQQVLRIVESGKIGPVCWVRRGLFNYARRNDWQSLRKYGGGMLSNYGAHGLDQVLSLIGFDVRRCFCNTQRIASLGDAEDVVKIVVETHRGVVGEVEINQASVLNPYPLLVWGTHGGITIKEGFEKPFELRWFDPARLPPKELDERLASAGRAYPADAIDCVTEMVEVDQRLHIDVFSDFANCIRDGKPPVVTPEESLALMETLACCRQDSGRIVTVEDLVGAIKPHERSCK